VGQDQRVVVGVHDAAGRADLLGDLVGGTGRGQARADVEELADAQARGVPGDPLAKGPVRPRRGHHLRPEPGHLVTGFPVGQVVVLAAQPVGVHPRRMRHPRIEPR
jgi:hypothetical protein